MKSCSSCGFGAARVSHAATAEALNDDAMMMMVVVVVMVMMKTTMLSVLS